ncbi:hypothetical protein [Novosphingobium sp. Gsoil 351]|uniref:hypothetical protein n=1 Tax=Novosphingobium sp. Gsoil 351 TaxID=2675225 RepID=UPI001E61430C|nr:hypothetical protein [Novosphingobium sp. Gsoil 351]
MAMVGIEPVKIPLSAAVSKTVSTSRSPLLAVTPAKIVSIADESRFPAGAARRKITCSPARIEVVASTVTSWLGPARAASGESAVPRHRGAAKRVAAPAPGTI